MAVGIFAGIPVEDYRVALEWYQRLLGSEPSFYPNDIEAVWQLAEDCHVYIIQDTRASRRRGQHDLGRRPRIRGGQDRTRGLEPVDVEKHDAVWKYVFHDADGNETGIGGEVASPT